MEPHQQRVVDEKRDLDEKHNKLRDFIGGDNFKTIVPADRERELLYRQSSAMAEYSLVLGLRLKLWGIENA